MKQINFGCQTYSWQMSYDRFSGKLPHILGTMKAAGFAGIEAEVCMMGEYFENWELFAELLEQTSMSYAAMALPLRWLEPKETAEEYDMAQRAIAFLRHFPGTQLVLCHLPGEDRSNLEERQRNQIACITEVARRAAGEGITASFHPNSSFGSAFRTADDYKLLLDRISGTDLGFAPDAGHIAHGDMDPVELINTYVSLVRHVHFKDMNRQGVWESMGRGSIDFPSIVSNLKDSGFKGWIMVEEESAAAAVDPDAVTLENGAYLKEALLPLVEGC